MFRYINTTNIRQMKKIYFFIIIVIGTFFLYSCGSEKDPYQSSDDSSEYFPLEVGNTWIYSVDSIVYDYKGTVIDTIHNEVQEKITNFYTDNEGVKSFIIERSNKKGNNWIVSNIWSANLDKTQATRTEDNLRFIKMVFPIYKNKSWDGNAYIDTQNQIVIIAGESIKMFEQWSYRYLDVSINETVGNNTYDDILVVQQVDNENSIQKRYSIEKYARNIGLVYKKMEILNSQKTDLDVPWSEKAEEGFILEQTLISFTK